MSELGNRLDRIYAALDGVRPLELNEFAQTSADLSTSDGEFQTSFSKPELENAAQAAIQNVASLPNHVVRWAKAQGIAKNGARARIEACAHLAVVRDLANNDKHGYPPRDGGISGKRPLLKDVDYAVSLGIPSDPSAESGTVSPKKVTATISGLIVDGDGNAIGDLNEWLQRATSELEEVLIAMGHKGIDHTPQSAIPRVGVRISGVEIVVESKDGTREVVRPRSMREGV